MTTTLSNATTIVAFLPAFIAIVLIVVVVGRSVSSIPFRIFVLSIAIIEQSFYTSQEMDKFQVENNNNE